MSLDLDELQLELSQRLQKASDWVSTRTKAAVDRKDQHHRFMAEQSEALRQLVALEEQLKVTAEQTKQRLHTEERELQQAQGEVAATRTKTAAVESRFQSAQDQLLSYKQEMGRRMAELEKISKQEQQALEYNQKKADMFASRFGLRVLEGDGEARFVLTQVDELEPDKEFVLGLRYADNTYTVSRCQPPLPGLEDMTMELNRTLDLRTFVKAVRNGFVQLARQSHGG